MALLGGEQVIAGERVRRHQTSLAIADVFSAVTTITETIATLPFKRVSTVGVDVVETPTTGPRRCWARRRTDPARTPILVDDRRPPALVGQRVRGEAARPNGLVSRALDPPPELYPRRVQPGAAAEAVRRTPTSTG